MKYLPSVILLMLLSSIALGLVSIESSVDKSQVYIGDRINYKVTMRYPKGYTVLKPPIGHNLGQFEIKDFQIGKPISKGNEELVIFNFVISTYDTGKFEIPPTGFAYKDSAGKEGVIITQPITINVLSLLKGERSSWQLRDIKKPLAYPFPWKRVLYFAIPLAAVLAGVLIFFMVKRKKLKGLFEIKAQMRPPHEIALERLANLKVPPESDPKGIKTYYIELTEILRQYIEDALNIPALELVSSEIIDALASNGIKETPIITLTEILRTADYVKFAKFIPETSTSEKLLDDAKTFVIETMPKQHEEPVIEKEEVGTV